MKVAFVQFSTDIAIGATGVGYVMGALVEKGHDVNFYVIDNSVYNISLSSLKRKLQYNSTLTKLLQHDILFLSCLSMDMEFASSLSHDIKSKSNIPIVVGGMHPTIVKGEILENYPDIDFICIGEGEGFAVDLVCKIESNEDYTTIKNLGYRSNGKIIINDIREPQDLKCLPAFPYHLYKKSQILDAQNNFAYVKATRGCQYSCNFCCNNILLKMYTGKYLRYRPISDVITEINLLKKLYHPTFIYFSDEMLLTNTNYAIELFKNIKSETQMPFAFLARVEHITDEVAHVASTCGCKYIAMGVECGDESFRKTHLNRHMTNEQIIEAFRLCKDYNIYTTSLNIIGYPFEYDNKLTESTIQFNKILNPDYLQASIFYPFQGTPLYNYCILNDLIDPIKSKNSTDCFTDSILKNASLSQKRSDIMSAFNKKPFLWGIKW